MRTLIAVISYDGDAANGNHDAIRTTWGKHVCGRLFHPMDLGFFIGRRGPEFVPKIDEIPVEWQEHRSCKHDWWVDVIGCCVDFWQVQTKSILQWSLKNNYDFTFMIENDTFVIPESFATSGYDKFDFCGHFDPDDTALGEKTKYEVYGEKIYPSPEPGIGYTLSRKAAKIVLDAPYDWHTIGVYAGQVLGPLIATGEIQASDRNLGSWHYRREMEQGYPAGSGWQKMMYLKQIGCL